MDQVERAVERFGASVAPVDKIHEAEVDIYAPCALGGVITEATATEVRARAVAGAANNKLATPEAGFILARRGILFAPDYVMNAGGILSGLEARSEERRVGKESVSTCRSRGSADH